MPEAKGRRTGQGSGPLGPIVERLGPPISSVGWSAELVTQNLEILPLGLRDGKLFWLRPVHAPSLRAGLSRWSEPGRVVLDVLGWYPVVPLVVHSTSWRFEQGRIVLTYVVVAEPPASLPPGSLEVVPVERSDIARGGAMSAPASIPVEAVLEHAIRHLAWLSREDPAIAAALSGWRDVLGEYHLEPFRSLG